jgi:hypothetical protein
MITTITNHDGHEKLAVNLRLRHLTAFVIAIGRNVVRALEFASGFIFHYSGFIERVVRTAHVARAGSLFSLGYSHDRRPYFL